MADFDKLLADARETVAAMDKTDRENGFAAPSDLLHDQPVSVLRTALCAIEAGIRIDDLTCVVDGYVMLQALERHWAAMTR